MVHVDLDALASRLATYAKEQLPNVHRAALLVRCSEEAKLVAAVVGNDDYSRSEIAKREVEQFRFQLREAAVEELAFGLSGDGSSWALLIRADSGELKTEAGKAFRIEMLRACLDDALWAAWRTAN